MAAPGAGAEAPPDPPAGERAGEAAAAGGAARLTMAGPVACVIRVRGALPPRLAARLGGLRITTTGGPDGDGAATTELRGELPDQAALRGVLTALHGLGLCLVAVDCAPPRPAAARAARAGPPGAGAALPPRPARDPAGAAAGRGGLAAVAALLGAGLTEAQLSRLADLRVRARRGAFAADGGGLPP